MTLGVVVDVVEAAAGGVAVAVGVAAVVGEKDAAFLRVVAKGGGARAV